MTELFGDRLWAAVEAKRTPACVGLDPLWDRLPEPIRRAHGGAGVPDDATGAGALQEFCLGVLDAVAELVPVVKINSAFFERYHTPGWHAFYEVVQAARDRGLLVIGDVKRADIGHSTTQYAAAHLAPVAQGNTSSAATPDAVTVNPYLGYDGVGPFVDVARTCGRGVFVLVQTSNASAVQLQGLKLVDGQPFCLRVAQLVNEWASAPGLIGAAGFSAVGAVVSPGAAADVATVRAAMPQCFFLVPGFGAQGRGAADVRGCFTSDGRGAIVNASRSVLYAYETVADRRDWRGAVAAAARQFIIELRAVTGR
ncbi:MAG TPA: orotidine-5'-phosphate decarboxylase [Phycisphaerae bacterium]|nr:orotidine-5'-phosphate decarboxylase [Phycisphaerae bacterium]HNU44196.1 orotidine-5'-phosphate decarboxylase [Phycisphaerae bacterium]